MQIITPGVGDIVVKTGEPLPTSPNSSGQKVNGKTIAIHMEGVMNVTVQVLFTPLHDGETIDDVSKPSLIALADSTWPTGIIIEESSSESRDVSSSSSSYLKDDDGKSSLSISHASDSEKVSSAERVSSSSLVISTPLWNSLGTRNDLCSAENCTVKGYTVKGELVGGYTVTNGEYLFQTTPLNTQGVVVVFHYGKSVFIGL